MTTIGKKRTSGYAKPVLPDFNVNDPNLGTKHDSQNPLT